MTSTPFQARAFAVADDLPLLAEGIVEGFLDGLHRSPFLGYSTEFSAYRSYTQGDNVRHIDWKVWGRSDELYVKQFEDDTNLRGWIFLDTSASMDFGDGDTNKFAYARLLAAVLAQLMVKQRDAPGLVLFGDSAQMALPSQATRAHAADVFALLARTPAAGRTRMEQDLIAILRTFFRRGVAVVISDFHADENASVDLIRQLHAQHQEVLVFHVLTPAELDFPYEGDFVMEDSETQEEVVVRADDYRAEYLRKMGEFQDRLRRACRDFEADYQLLRTDEPLDRALIAYLERRASV